MNRHAVLFLAYDQVPEQSVLTVQAIETVLAQDIGPMDVLLIDNASTQGRTWEHFQMIRDLYIDREDETRVHTIRHRSNIAPLKIVNRALPYFFAMGHDKVLGVPNDVMLPPNFYRLLSSVPRGMVCASETREKAFPLVDAATIVSACTPMATTVIRKWFWEALKDEDGWLFDENMTHYASDCDLAVRMVLAGISGCQTDVPFWHYGSASHLLLPHQDGQVLRDQADRDRAYFRAKWGFAVDSWEYGHIDPNLQPNLKAKAVTA